MYGLFDWQFWLSSVWFVVAIIGSYYLPGALFIRRFQLSAGIHYLISFVLGMVLWGLQGYILGYLELRWLTYGYLILAWAGAWHNRDEEITRVSDGLAALKKISLWPVLVLIAGSVIQLAQVITTGLKYQGTINFFRINAYDGVMHLAFVQALVKHVPAEQPGAIGLPLTNYHYWSDLLVADLVRVWHLPIIHVFFQFMPIILAVGTGVAVWQLVRWWGGSTSTVVWSLLILYFASDLVYVFTLALHRTWGAPVAAIDNGAMQLLNIPHSYAKFVFLTSLIPLTQWFKEKSMAWGWVSIFLLASLTGLKVYFGIFSALGLSLVVGSFGLLSVYQAWQSRESLLTVWWKLRWLWLPFGLMAVISMAIYFPANRNSGGLFWSPLEWPKLFLGMDHIHWPAWWLRKQVYDTAQNQRGIIFMDLVAIAICLLSVFGMRLIGLLPNLGWYKKIGWPVLMFLLPTSYVFIFLGLYTLQTSGLFNVFNFFAVATIPLALMTGFTLDTLWRRNNLVFKLLPIIVILLGLPRIALTTSEAVTYQAQMKVERAASPDKQAAYAFIREQLPTDAVIQSHPANEFERRTPALAFFTNRPTFMTGISMLESHNQPVADRVATLKAIFASTSATQLAQELHANGIEYLYLEKTGDQELKFELPAAELPIIFENEETMVIQAN